MHDGSVKKVEDIAVGDLLMGNDGRLRIVYQALRGREEMVRVSPAIWKPRHEKVLSPRRGRRRRILQKLQQGGQGGKAATPERLHPHAHPPLLPRNTPRL